MIAEKIRNDLGNSSWIRAMFEEGERLRQIHGTDKVYDFSLGNPDYEPAPRVQHLLRELVSGETPGLHRYTPNAGDVEARARIAAAVAEDCGLPLGPEHIVMTCGAAGGLNVVLKAILNPGDEIIVLSPFFVEYLFYIDNHGGKSVVAPTTTGFEPDLETLDSAIGPRCRGIILNSPNNPTGVVYSQETLQALSILLEKKEKEFGTEILVISDEPYSKLVYDDVKVTSVLKVFKNSVAVNSFSKSLALPGERIGYIAVSPAINEVDMFINGLVFANRTLGFVNAPSLFMKLVSMSLDEVPPVEEYKRRRDYFYDMLAGLGFKCTKPDGAFYLFPRSPLADDVEFVRRALKYNLLLVPGKGFGCPGYFRIAYCVSFDTIKNSQPAFEALAAELNMRN
ncbi:pyridoxal phosphate-dependent aminotransferase [Syntrophomonas palmitatica]|uniref:pyridoxal phosphate-dependent aminotransferase n=1 Tax=Syntrophomonas palmitatica TaxID=402877 RepID=UPI0006D1597B|nr:pyridoxal phosphate-dependent aminotransferase [Syntrophomonas palmitatica]